MCDSHVKHYLVYLVSRTDWGLCHWYKVCSRSIRIGIVVVVYWVGCVCNQSGHVRTCLSKSWHKLHVAAFAQLAVVGRGSNTCVCVIAIFTMCESTEQRICIKFCFKIEKPQRKLFNYCSKHSVKMQVFDWFRRFKECRTSVESDLCSGWLSTSRNWRFLIPRVSYTTSTLPTGKQLTRNSTWKSCDVCVNQFAENDRKNGGMATGSCTTTMRPHTHCTSCAAVFGQIRHCSVAAATILTRSRTVWLFPTHKA